MADRLNVTDLDFDTLKTNLKNFLKQQSEFSDYDFEGAGLNVLLDILAYNTHYNSYYLNMLANESFLDSAILRNSVVSHAKRFGYTPRSASAPVAKINFSIDSLSSTPGSVTLPEGYIFLSNLIDSKSYNFITLEDTTVSKTGNNFVFTNLEIYEGQLATYSFTHVEASNPKQIFTLPDINVDTSTIKVSVRQSNANLTSTVYTLNTDALDVASNSEVFYIQEGQNNKYEIYFGNNVLGKKIPDGGIVSVKYLITNGDLANKANSFIATATVGGYSTFTVNSTLAASGGTPRETVDQIKFAAPLQFTSQNRAVTKNDYIKLIQQKYPQFEAVNVWGGEENDPPIFGKVFISAKPKQGFEVTDAEKEFVKEKIIKPISILTVTPEIVDVDYNFLKLMEERGAVLIDTEIVLGDPELGYVGQGDTCWLIMNKSKTGYGFIITDYKSNKKKNMETNNYTKPMREPFKHLPNNALGHYNTQLPLYGKLLLKMLKGSEYENLPLLGCIIVHLTDDQEFTEYRVDRKDIDTIMEMNIKPKLTTLKK